MSRAAFDELNETFAAFESRGIAMECTAPASVCLTETHRLLWKKSGGRFGIFVAPRDDDEATAIAAAPIDLRTKAAWELANLADEMCSEKRLQHARVVAAIREARAAIGKIDPQPISDEAVP